MKKKFKFIVCLTLALMFSSEIAQTCSAGQQVVWAQEESTSNSELTIQSKESIFDTEVSDKQESIENTSENDSSSQNTVASSTEIQDTYGSGIDNSSTSKNQIDEVSPTQVTEITNNSQASTSTSTQDKEIPTPLAYENDTQAKAAAAAITAYKKKIAEAYSNAQSKTLGNYKGASVSSNLTIAKNAAPSTEAINGSYKWVYTSKITITMFDYSGSVGDNSFSTSVSNTSTNNVLTIDISRDRANHEVAQLNKQIPLSYTIELIETEWAKNPITGNWDETREKKFTNNVGGAYTGTFKYSNVDGDGIPSNFQKEYAVWRQKAATSLVQSSGAAIASAYEKLGSAVGDTTTFTVPLQTEATTSGSTANIFKGRYIADASKFSLVLSNDLASCFSITKTGNTSDTMTFSMKRLKKEDPTGSPSISLSVSHDKSGQTITVSSFKYALPMEAANIKTDKVSTSIGIDNRTITATPIEQDILIGTQEEDLPAASDMITDVRLNDGVTVNPSGYTAEIISVPTFDTLEVTDTIEVKLTRRKTGVSTTIKVPVKMKWNGTIQLKGNGDRSAGAYTLHKVNGKYFIRASYGFAASKSELIHSYYNSTYYSLEVLTGDGRLDNLAVDYTYNVKGTSKVPDVIKAFGTGGEYEVQLGDIVKIFHEEPKNRHKYVDDTQKEITPPLGDDQTVYYLVTADGFVPYRLNALSANEMSITTATSDKELDELIDEMINFNGYTGNGLSVSKITKYPDRSTAGKTTGTVEVKETIDGVTHTFEYEVPFIVDQEWEIQADVIEQEVLLGTKTDELPDVNKMFENVTLNDPDQTPVNPDGYTAEILSVPTFDNMEVTDTIEVKLTRRKTGLSTTLHVPVKMKWNGTIQLKGNGDRSAGAYTLHNVNGKYFIRTSYGFKVNDSYAIHDYYPGTYYSLELLTGDGLLDNLAVDYTYNVKGTSKVPDVINNFGTGGEYEVQLGDIVKIFHEEPKNRHKYVDDTQKEITPPLGDDQTVYYLVTADGFVPYHLNVLSANKMTVDILTTEKELDQLANEMIDFKGYTANDLKISKITTYPDCSAVGEATGKVLVEETIAGVTHTTEYSVPFTIVDQRKVQADPIPQDILIGTKESELPDVSDMFENVTLDDGTAINPDGYTAKITSVPSFDSLAETDTIQVELTRRKNGSTTIIEVPVNMKWNGTIQLKGLSDKTAGAYTLHHVSSKYVIRSSFGVSKELNKDMQVHSSYDSTYYTLSVLSGTGQLDKLSVDYMYDVKGTDKVSDVINNFGTGGEYEVQLGDIVKIFHEEPKNRHKYVDDTQKEITPPLGDDQTVYYLVTADGFVPYHLNVLSSNDMTIAAATTDKELDALTNEMINFKGYNENNLKVAKITEYPDRSAAGKTSGKVLVEETINGETHNLEYEVAFTVVDNLSATGKQMADLPLGITISSKPSDYVTVATTPEDEAKLTFEWVDTPIETTVIGKHQATVRITSQTFNQTIDVPIDYTVIYGKTIVLGDTPMVGFSLFDNSGTPRLVSTGLDLTPNVNLALRPQTSIYRQSTSNKIFNFTTQTVYQRPSAWANGWNESLALSTTDLTYGDVLAIQTFHQAYPGTSLNGSQTYVARNETLVKEAEGFMEAMYELTPAGYNLLSVNRLTPTLQEIEKGTTKEELAKRVEDFLSVENHPELKVKEFESYPDTSKTGLTEATIRVTETLSSGNTFDYDYVVKFNVIDPKLVLTSDLKVANLSRNEEETNVGDELLYVYTLTNSSPLGKLKSGSLSIELPKELNPVGTFKQDVTVPQLGIGETFTYQVKVKVTEQAINQNPVVRVTGKATNESDIEQDIPEAKIEVPGGVVGKIDTSEINITIPSKMNFGADEDTIISPVYKIENNSQVPVEVKVDQFDADVNLKGKDLVLNLVSDDKNVVLFKDDKGLHQAESLGILNYNEVEIIEFSGSVKSQKEVSKSSSIMRFRFKPTP
ncbi:putative mucin/carbohydrate-binding domain-containing protein [Candidatus Enterococcus courvalinii]|uniref:Uncharacterized protein n=1 Tax=Candidatus Enterococcus courvalinii TaxID=2815329 RepID=A0ABS3HYQ7_9ENTE|nr:putative mucin/carbohydrate-binding domain-containing protein [Enterococcus sp. MSG2901]MBO0480988.1 hypothetical protein [Enterococcus sp. MSG2901]